MKNKIHGLFLLIISVMFAHIETRYFGSNQWAESTAEWICDIIALLINLTGLYLLTKKP